MGRCSFIDVIMFVFFLAGVMGQFDNCTGQLDTINDGRCDDENNTAECRYDGGDCCECSCMNDRLYPCGTVGFSCSDPDLFDNTGYCQNETTSVIHCASDVSQTSFVNDTTSAISLAEAVNCSGGTFNVTWVGSVLVNRTLLIPNGTTLYVTGGGPGAEVNGGGKIRLFMAVGADLHIERLILSNGNATYGGAIAATRSSIYLNQTLSSGNIASSYGGAIYADMSSTLTWEGQTMLQGNHAGRGGGAVAISMNSTASLCGDTELSFNSAVGDGSLGGAVYVNDHSRLTWDGETSFVNNTATIDGGGLAISSTSSVSWDGETYFVNNTALGGGALHANLNSTVSWAGSTSFVNNTGFNGGTLSANADCTFSWNGKTFFAGNTASNVGGVLYAYSDATVSWDGETSFVDNTASDGGGALFVKSYSTVLWDGETSFVDNTAGVNGGALYVSSGSTVSWDGVSSFVNNTARNGGALNVNSDCTVSWDGESSFVNNTANDNGGALFVFYNTTVSWDGETSFVSNTAFSDGGVLGIENNSIVSWDGNTSFTENTASNDGGALYVYSDSTVSWEGSTSFFNNTAQNGGALYAIWDSIVLWTGVTSFSANNAISNGGAIQVTRRSNITVGGETNFLDNEAGMEGGAAYVYVGYDDAISSYFAVDNNLVLRFRGNTCGVNGGAIAFIGGVVALSPLKMTFWENTAGIAGGAIYMSGVNIGMLFNGTMFMSNSALIGGGIYSTGSGTAVTEDVYGKPKYNPTTFIGCEFIGNEAVKTGGAVDSGAGRDIIVNTSFVDNTASLGGALRLVGTTSLMECEFVKNLSGEDEGPGISNDGVLASVSNCIFVDNTFNCQAGFFLAYNETGALFDTVCKGCDTQCSGCTVEGKEPICLEELEHSTSTGDNTTLKSLLIERGYWRATNTSVDILECYNTEACLGGLTGEQGYCGEGYEGPYCSVCSKGYTASLGFACSKCSDNASGGIALAVVMAFVFLLASVAFISYMLSGEREGPDQGIVARVTRFIPLQSAKIVIVVWQILTQFSTVANVIFPSVYQRFLDGVDVLNFDLSWVLSAECIIDIDFHDQLLLATMGPLVCMVILGGTYVVATRRGRDSGEGRGIARQRHVSMVLLLTFLVYSSVSSTLFKTFACDELDDGKNYLRADYRIECDSSRHKDLEIYAGFMVILYVVGIPAFYGVLLYNNREALTKNTGREENDSIKPITDLWKPFRPNQFYYEVLECVRRVSLTGALVFIYPNTAAQIAVALMMATFFIFVSEALAPYASPWDTWCSRTGHAIVFTSMFLALLLKVDVSGERTSSQKVFESVLIAAHSCLILIVVVEAIAMVMAWRREVKEDTEPRIRPSLSILSPGVDRGRTIPEDVEIPPSYENVVRDM